MKEWCLMLKIETIKEDDGFELMKKLQPILEQLAEFGTVEGGLIEK